MRILLALDLDSHPVALVEAAQEWALRLSAPIDLVYVDARSPPMPRVHDPAVQNAAWSTWRKKRAEYEERLGVLLESLPDAHRGRAIVESGPVSAAVVRLAEDPAYGLVIFGNDSRAGLASLLGSASESLLRAFRKPVMLLRVGP